jgi:fluoride exporter
VPERTAVRPGGHGEVRRRPTAAWPAGPDLAAVAVGGGVGSAARYLLSVAIPAGHGFPWGIFIVNVTGCLALGGLLVYLLEVWPPRPLLRPLLAVGLLGGYTTFSTYAAGVLSLLTGRQFALADAYALSSIVAALAAVWCGMVGARKLAGWRDAVLAREDEPAAPEARS